jgi:hypothetical protein
MSAPPNFSPTSSHVQAVVVTDIDMTTSEMCFFMVKWAIAAIPAAIILALIVGIVGSILFSGTVALFSHH